MVDDLVHLKIHFDGIWMRPKNCQMSLYDYVNGRAGDVKIDLDRVGYFDLIEEAKEFSRCPKGITSSLQYLNDFGLLVDVKDDKDTMSMLECLLRRKGVGHIFFEWEDVALVQSFEAGPSTQVPQTEKRRKISYDDNSHVQMDFNFNFPIDDDTNQFKDVNDDYVEEDYCHAINYNINDDLPKGMDDGMIGSCESDNESWNAEDDLHSSSEDTDASDYKHCNDDYDDDDDEVEDDLYADGDFPGEDRTTTNPSLLQLQVGQRFIDVNEYRDHLRLHAVQHHYEYILVKNEKDRVTAKCKDEHCKWRCHASPIDQFTYEVKTMNSQHTCVSRVQSTNCVARSLFVTKYIVQKMKKRGGKKYNPLDIIDDIHEKFQIYISYDVAWYSRLKALEIIYGSYDESYFDVPELCRQILLSNPRNRAKWHKEVDGTFGWIYVSYHAVLEQWRMNCRPVVGLDGCFLKGKYGGVCMAATGLDGNRGLYPLAIFVCNSEDSINWNAFLSELENVLYHDQPLTFYSDRQKGLLDAVTNVFPGASHRYCMRHIYANFKLQFKGKLLKDTVWQAASTYELCVWHETMMRLKQICPPAYDYMAAIEPKHWARSHFDWSSNCGHLTNNFSESFNHMIKKMRDLPVTQFMEKLNVKLIEMINKRKNNAVKMVGHLTKNMTKEMKIKANKLRLMAPQNTSDRLVMVTQGDERKWEVDIISRTCTCTEWQISGIPCTHAMVALFNRRMDPNEFLHKYYHLQTFMNLYNENIRMIADKKSWLKGNKLMLPPNVKRAPGRPKTSRIREEDENAYGSTGHKCGVCGNFGHNRTRCPNGPNGHLHKKLKTKRGRGGGGVAIAARSERVGGGTATVGDEMRGDGVGSQGRGGGDVTTRRGRGGGVGSQGRGGGDVTTRRGRGGGVVTTRRGRGGGAVTIAARSERGDGGGRGGSRWFDAQNNVVSGSQSGGTQGYGTQDDARWTERNMS